MSGVTDTSDGAVVVSKAENTVKCKSGEQRWFLSCFGLAPDDENMDDFDIQLLPDLMFKPTKSILEPASVDEPSFYPLCL